MEGLTMPGVEFKPSPFFVIEEQLGDTMPCDSKLLIYDLGGLLPLNLSYSNATSSAHCEDIPQSLRPSHTCSSPA